MKVKKKIETSSLDEISGDSIDGDLHLRVEVQKAFKRPKRPAEFTIAEAWKLPYF